MNGDSAQWQIDESEEETRKDNAPASTGVLALKTFTSGCPSDAFRGKMKIVEQKSRKSHEKDEKDKRFHQRVAQIQCKDIGTK